MPDEGEKLRRITKYAGGAPEDEESGLEVSINVGAVGRAYRTKKAIVSSLPGHSKKKASQTHAKQKAESGQPRKRRENKSELVSPPKELEAFLVETWSFSAEAATLVRKDRKAWAAFPVLRNDGTVLAVIFADSNDADFFGINGSVRRKILLGSAAAVAEKLRGN